MMYYRAVGGRLAVDLGALRVPLSRDEILALLGQEGFTPVGVDIIALARQCIGTSRYRRGAQLAEAPCVVDCSSLIKWLYGQRGIWLPRRSIQQRALGEGVSFDGLVAGDVVFTSGWTDYFDDDPEDGVGHVGISTGEGTIIHAADKKSHVVETTPEVFLGKRGLRGVRRYIPKEAEVLTFEAPINREIETMDDVRWIIFQSLPKKG